MNRETKRRWISAIVHDNSDFKNRLFSFINSVSLDELSGVLEALSHNSKFIKKHSNMLFPNSIKKLCQNDWYINRSFDTKKLLNYCSFVIKCNKTYLNDYLELKMQFENCICRNELQKGLDILEQIDDKVGLSFWGLIKRLAILDNLKGFEEHKKYVSKLQEIINKNVLMATVIDLQSLFAEHKTNYGTYKKKVDALKEALKKRNSLVYQYLDFKLCPERSLKKDELSIALLIDSQLSFVDMYETFVIAYQASFISKTLDEDLIQNYNDKRMLNVLRIKNKTPEICADMEYYSLLELYSCGEYEKCIKQSSERLIRYPADFQCMILLVKSYILCNKQPIFENDLYNCLYNVYSFESGEESSIQKLLSSLKLYMGTSLEYKILGFVARKTCMKGYEQSIRMSILCDYNLSPNLTNIADLSGNPKVILDAFSSLCPITTKLFMFKYGYNDFPEEVLDVDRRKLFESERLIENNEYQGALKIIDSIERMDGYMSERVLRRKIRAYRICGNYPEMVQCITESVLNNRALRSRLDLLKLYGEVKRHLTENLKRSIYYVVFVSICYPDDVGKTRIAFTNYMEKNGLKSIESICDHEKMSKTLVEFFYSVCTRPLLKRDRILNCKQTEADNIRIAILKKLIELDSSNTKQYNSEISAITKKNSINERIRLINNSKIYADVDGIKKEIGAELYDDFERYLAIQELDEDIISYDYENQEYIQNIDVIISKMNDKIKNSLVYSQRLIVLREIITRITEEFLFNSKYGLNFFLSGRIRHGYVKNQLTSVFEDNNLLSKKKTNNSIEYTINEYWDARLPKRTSGGNEIRKCISRFTLSIQNMVDKVKDQWLCIKFKDKSSDAFLDYTKIVQQLMPIDSINIKDFNEFYSKITDSLWNHTDKLLSELREKIDKELVSEMGAQLNLFSSDLQKISDNTVQKELEELIGSINLCKAKYEQGIKEFEKVLERSNDTNWNFSMTDLVDTCLEIENKLNPHFSEVIVQRSINDRKVYKGEFFTYFVDILTILLTNAFEHSGIEHYGDMFIKIDVRSISREEALSYVKLKNSDKIGFLTDEEYYYLSVTNRLNDDISIEELNETLQKLFTKIKDTNVIKEYSQIEGGTGLAKLCNVLDNSIDESYLVLYDFPSTTNVEIIVILSTNIIVHNNKDLS